VSQQLSNTKQRKSSPSLCGAASSRRRRMLPPLTRRARRSYENMQPGGRRLLRHLGMLRPRIPTPRGCTRSSPLGGLEPHQDAGARRSHLVRREATHPDRRSAGRWRRTTVRGERPSVPSWLPLWDSGCDDLKNKPGPRRFVAWRLSVLVLGQKERRARACRAGYKDHAPDLEQDVQDAPAGAQRILQR
jgi:hypothetical protein